MPSVAVRLLVLSVTLCLWLPASAAEPASAPPKRILLVAGAVDGSHPPGTHEYVRELRALQKYLERSNIASRVEVELAVDRWKPAQLEQADTIVVFSNGADRKEDDHPLLRGDNWAQLRQAMNRGCGLILLHWSTFLPDRHAEDALEWAGGYFDYQEGEADKSWYSKIQHATAVMQPASREHPICRGLTPFRLADEYYYRMRFRERDSRRTPIIQVTLPGESEPQEVAWAVERNGGGRGFVFTGCHFLNSLELPNFRRLLLNACAWTAHVDVPPGGVALEDERPINTILVTGHQHPAHEWRETSLALEDELRRDPRVRVETVPDPEFLALDRLHEYDVVVLNYCNWDQPEGLSAKARDNFRHFLADGGGLVLVHFANGAFHPSLPGAGASDWPEYRTRICRRVWDHSPGASGHDAYGSFRVDIASHRLTTGLSSYETRDELYFRQQGEEPIEVLATAKSQVTGRDEPMAFVYDYHDGRVFQTVLGHAVESLRTAGTAELLRRGTAWVAGYRPTRSEPEVQSAADALVPGRFSTAFDARRGHAQAEHRPAYDQWPLTVECWAQVYAKDRFQILLAKNPKTSALHWELYTYAGAGDFSVYLPGWTPAEIRSGVQIADGKWHHVALTFDGRQVMLYVDGRHVKQERLTATTSENRETSPLWFGAYPPGSLSCDGLIDDVRISKGIRKIEQFPQEPAIADEPTIGRWSFDELRDGGYLDASLTANHARPFVDSAAMGGLEPVKEDHFEGFQESQVVDDRLREMDTGHFLAATVATPDGPTWKGLVVRVGEDRSASVCFDTELLRWSGAWDGFLDFSPARFGLIGMPKPASDVRIATAREPGWSTQGSFADPRPKRPYGSLPADLARFGGQYLHGERVVITYRVGDMQVAESPWLEREGDRRAFTRSLEVSGSTRAQTLRVCRGDVAVSLRSDSSGIELRKAADGHWVVAIPPRPSPARFRLWLAADQRVTQSQLDAWAAGAPLEPLTAWQQPGPARWTAELVLEGRRAEDGAAYVVDTIPVPFDNPYRALMFTSGHDFFSNGDAAVCTAHGDVWRVSGIDDKLANVRWKRMVAGLFQPLGIKVIQDRIYVAGRDQISVLYDHNGDNEIDFIQNLNNDGHVSANGHEYVTNLECDANGNFYVLKGDSGGVTDHDGCLLRVTPDGERLEVVATGIRNGNGLAIGPDDVITASPQEGNWTPASAILEVKSGGFYGMMDVHHRAIAPTSFDPPLCFIPRPLDNSSGGQVWAPPDNWGPLSGHLLHFSFGRCRMLLVLRDRVDDRTQGSVISLPLEFESGAMRGRFRPQDGQLYVTGLRGWVTSAVRDGCFQRVRYTGTPSCLPIECSAHANGVTLRFSSPLNRRTAEDPANYTVEAWNYRWSKDYGSEDYRVSAPEQKGHDVWEVRSASLLDDECSVFLELPQLVPAHQVSLTYSVSDASGEPFQSSVYATIHRLHADSIRPTSAVRSEKLIADDAVPRLLPGLWATWTGPDGVETRPLTVVARSWPERLNQTAASAEPTRLIATGWLRAEQRQRVRLRVDGAGQAQLVINGLRVLDARGESLSRFPSCEVVLVPGFNRVELSAECSAASRAFRLTWQGESFGEETPAPTRWWHDPAEIPEQEQLEHRLADGRWLFDRLRCANCHAPRDALTLNHDGQGPALTDVAQRLEPAWLVAWLRAPHRLRPDATMPDVLRGSATRDQDAVDLAAFLLGNAVTAPPTNSSDTESPEALVRTGERLYESLGCIACHTLDDEVAEQAAELEDRFARRVALTHVASKFRTGALAKFLSDPQAHYPSTRMPRFQLAADELDGLAEFLKRRGSTPLPAVALATADAQRGRLRFGELGCAQCHRVGAEANTVARRGPALSASSSQRGCLADGEMQAAAAPDFALSQPERSALQAFVTQNPMAQARHISVEELGDRTRQFLRCGACHDHEERGAAWPQILLDEGALGLVPERVPALTWVGEKLRSDWTERLLLGRIEYRPRPWLTARMPAFPNYAERVALGLAARHGMVPLPVETHREPLTESDRMLVENLLGKNGLDCRQCHAPAGENLNLANQAQGIGLAFMPDRLREEYFYRWLRDPLRIDPSTKMPQFTTDGRTTKARHLADGDAQRQFEAIWRFLNDERSGASGR